MAKKNFKKSAVATVLGGKPTPKPVKSTSAQMYNDTDAQPTPDEQPDVRLHCFIRSDLNDWLIGELFRRKKDQAKFKGRDSKRAIIEKALETFFR